MELLNFVQDYFKKEGNQVAINYNILQKFRPDGYGGVAIGLRRHIRFTRIHFPTYNDIIVIKTTNLRRNYVFASIYFPPSVTYDDFKSEVERLFGFLDKFDNVVLCGDFNARNQAWGDHVTSRKGKELELLALEAGFSCVNNGKETFKRNNDSQGSVLDLSFVSSGIATKWDVLEGYFGGSHHFPVTLEVDFGAVRTSKFLHKSKLMKELSKLELEPNFTKIEEVMTEEVKAATKDLRTNWSPKYWWNNELTVAYRRQLATVKKSRKYPSYHNLEEARKEVDNWKQMVLKAKADSFNSKIEEVNGNGNVREAWRFLNNVRKRNCEVLSAWDHDKDMEYLRYLKVQVPADNYQITYNDDGLNNNEHIVFDFDHFEKILNNKKKGSAGGQDKITYEMLRALPEISKRALLTAMYDAFIDNSIKDSWRIVKIVPIPKPNKDLTDLTNICFCKMHKSNDKGLS
ncbi:uncharacterized protein [Musca autumnalis]|uniref:uncharacterized protein n=1 Tax=Musca autumnalis TaxID=221902 RepID=UPI003CEACFF1